jgi:ABC-2 type transport system permease protein
MGDAIRLRELGPWVSEKVLSNTTQQQRAIDRLPSEEREGQIFWKLRWRVAQTQLKQHLEQARLRTSLVVGLSLLFWCGLFWLFYRCFVFVTDNVGPPGAAYHAQTVQFVFSLFFVSLQVMLVFSAGIILYGGLYTSRESTFLMTLPVRDSRLVFFQFQEALFFSSWGFFLLASPMIVAYGMVVTAPWYYYAYLPVMLVSFAYIPSALGAIVCLLLINRLPHLRKAVVVGMALLVIGAAYFSIWQTLNMGDVDLLGAAWFKETFDRFEFTRGEWMPSTWLSNGLLDAARRPVLTEPNDLPWLESGKYLIVLVSNALFLHLVVIWVGKRAFRSSYSRMHARQAREHKPGTALIDRLAGLLLRPLAQEKQLLILKDLKTFRRDPVQWSQFLIFFGLLLLYFANIDRFRQHRSEISMMAWVNVVSFLNLAVVGLILSTFTTRFIFPLISLEGRRFWILGRLPVDRDTILWSKFLFAAGGALLPCSALVLISDLVIDVSPLVVALHQLVCVLLCLGLSGMAVGLGAMMPDFQEQSPSKIAAGFGGTLNLVLSALYILLIVLMTALPCHFYLLTVSAERNTQILQHEHLGFWLSVGVAGSLVLAAVATIVPMRSGLKAFRQLEV